MRTVQHFILPIAAIAMLSGCGKSADAPKSPEEMSQAAADIPKPQPGQYRTTITIADISFPGMPEARAAQMKKLFGAAGQTRDFCLTQAEADRGFEDFNKRVGEGKCSYDRFSAEGGKLDAAMHCETGKGMTTRAEMHGEFSPTGSQLEMTSSASSATMPGGGMTMRMKIVNQRIGDCG